MVLIQWGMCKLMQGETNFPVSALFFSSFCSIALFSQSNARHSWEGAFACL